MDDQLIIPVEEFSGGRKPDKDVQLGKRVSDKLSEGDITGAVRLLASSSEISPENDETLTALRQKHSLAPEDLSLPAGP